MSDSSAENFRDPTFSELMRRGHSAVSPLSDSAGQRRFANFSINPNPAPIPYQQGNGSGYFPPQPPIQPQQSSGQGSTDYGFLSPSGPVGNPTLSLAPGLGYPSYYPQPSPSVPIPSIPSHYPEDSGTKSITQSGLISLRNCFHDDNCSFLQLM